MQPLKSNIRNALKVLVKHKFHYAINAFGLSLGFALTLFILMYVRYEMSYDRQHVGADRLYRLYSNGVLGDDSIRTAASPFPSNRIFNQMDSLIEKATLVLPGANKLVTYEKKSYSEDHFYYSDSAFFDVFNLTLLSGDRASLLRDSFSVVISQSIAQKYFNHENPMGKVLDADNGLRLTVTGVFEDMTKASHFHCDFIASITSIDKLFKSDTLGYQRWKNNWLMLNAYNYLRLCPNVDPNVVEKKFNELIKEEMDVQLLKVFNKSELDQKRASIYFGLQSVTQILA
jgi:putative ABC transport system permease protein